MMVCIATSSELASLIGICPQVLSISNNRNANSYLNSPASKRSFHHKQHRRSRRKGTNTTLESWTRTQKPEDELEDFSTRSNLTADSSRSSSKETLTVSSKQVSPSSSNQALEEKTGLMFVSRNRNKRDGIIYQGKEKDTNAGPSTLIFFIIMAAFALVLLLILFILIIQGVRAWKRRKQEASIEMEALNHRPKPIKCGDISKDHFKYCGALILDPGIKGEVRHVASDDSKNILNHIEFDSNLNEIVDIGTSAEQREISVHTGGKERQHKKKKAEKTSRPQKKKHSKKSSKLRKKTVGSRAKSMRPIKRSWIKAKSIIQKSVDSMQQAPQSLQKTQSFIQSAEEEVVKTAEPPTVESSPATADYAKQSIPVSKRSTIATATPPTNQRSQFYVLS